MRLARIPCVLVADKKQETAAYMTETENDKPAYAGKRRLMMADDLVKWLRHHDLNATCWIWEADDIRKILEAADTIEQQQAEIERLRNHIAIERAENKRLREELDDMNGGRDERATTTRNSTLT